MNRKRKSYLLELVYSISKVLIKVVKFPFKVVGKIFEDIFEMFTGIDI